MLEATTRIYVRDPERRDDLVPGVVSETLGPKVMVRFLQPVAFAPGVQTVVFFHNQNDAFTSVPCQMQRMFSRGQYPTGALVLTGQAQIAESRSSFRIDIHDQSVTAVANGEDHGEVANISCSGVALLLDSEQYEPGKWLKIALQYDGDSFSGKMQVRGRSQEKDGRFRYGLMADPAEPSLISQLSRISQELQNLKARRGSRLGVNNKAKNQAPREVKNTEADAEAKQPDTEPQSPAPPGDSKRQHQRNPWPGMAKIYIREENNLRVLSVDTADLSRGGISFICPQYIYEGSEVLFEKPIDGGFFRVMVAVRNVHVQEGGVHRIGAQFLGAPMQPGKMPEGYGGSLDAA